MMTERRTCLAQELDHRLVGRLMEFAQREFGETWLDGVIDAVLAEGSPPLDPEELGLLMPLALFILPAPGDSISVSFLFQLDAGRSTTDEERKHLIAQRKAICSLWMAEEVHRGHGIALRDLLTKELRYVHERLGSQSIEVGEVLLARVVDTNDVSLIAGVHPQPMHSDRALMLVDRIRQAFGARTRALKWGELSPFETQAWIVGSWREWVAGMAEPPTLRNSDDDPFVSTIDHFLFDPARERELVDRLSRISGAVTPDAGSDESEIVITRAPRRRSATPAGPIVIGTLRLARGRMRAETNSAKRADALRKSVERAGRGLLRHSLREEEGTELILREAMAKGRAARRASPTPPEQLGAIQQMKREYYERWLDERIPMLGGKTPRQAAKSKAALDKLLALLAGLERAEGTLPDGERMDVGWLKRELGLHEP